MSNYLDVPVIATGATTPHKAGLVVGTSTLDLRAEVTPNSWANGNFQTIMGQYATGGAPDMRYGFWIMPSGGLEVDWLNTSSTASATSTVSTGFSPGVTKWVRALHNVAAGTIIFYTSVDGSSWTQLGATISGLSTLGYATTGTAPVLRIGSDATGDNFIGKITQTRVLVGGSTIINMDWTTATIGTGPWVATSGETWTKLGSSSVALTGGPPPPVYTLADNLVTRGQTLGQQVISNISPLYANGVFYRNGMGGMIGFGTTMAAGMATLYKYATNPTIKAWYLQTIQELVARELATNTTTGGLFLEGSMATGPFAGFYGAGPTRAANGGTVPNDLNSIIATADLGWILYQMPSGSISESTRAAWLAVCKANCDYLDITIGDTTWYINGNFNARLLGTYWFTAMNCTTTADRTKYEDMYERALRFLVDPNGEEPGGGWSPGYGLVTTSAGSEYDWSDYTVYLTENGGLDYIYSMVQLDCLCRVFVTNRDTRLARLINGISNAINGRINTTTWTIDASGGSRQGGTQPTVVAYLAVQALLGTKSSNRTLLTDDMVLANWYAAEGMQKLLVGTTTQFWGWAGDIVLLATVLEAAHIAQFRVPLT